MLSCLVRCVKIAAKFDDFSISENYGYLDSYEKVQEYYEITNWTRPQSMLYSKLQTILVEKVTQYSGVCIFLASLFVTLRSLT